jgi:hypothetical protein
MLAVWGYVVGVRMGYTAGVAGEQGFEWEVSVGGQLLTVLHKLVKGVE